MPYTQENRLMAIGTPLGEDVLLLTGFTGEEGISRLFRFQISLISTNDSIDFSAIVGKEITIRVNLPDASQRYFNGIVSNFTQGGRDTTFFSYQAETAPWLWFLTRTSDCRIFQRKKVPDIVTQIFDELGFKDYKLQLDLLPAANCVQYRETDFNFVSRLLEEEGIFYYFEHDNGVHTLVLADDPAANKPCPNQEQARYSGAVDASQQEEDLIREWRVRQEVRPGVYSQSDFNFQQPARPLIATVSGKSIFEIYDYHPGEYLQLTATSSSAPASRSLRPR